MKITELELKNIKCFEHLKISFKDQDTIKNWSLVVGNNGQGKTTILRSIAIGLCDKEGVSALLAELYGGFLRDSEDIKEGFIKISLEDTNNKSFTITTTIKINGNNHETIAQETKPKEGICRDNLFAVAYGSGRAIQGTNSYEEYALVDSIYTLFNYETGLQNPELAALRVDRNSKKDWKTLQRILKSVLMLQDVDSISLEKAGLYVKGKWGKRSFNTISDGYQSLASVILDFISWKLLKEESFNLTDNSSFSGIFIIDEIEQHLHPKWQRHIIKTLSEQFPNVQFICSTNSPLCALGLSDLDNTKSQLIKACYVNGHSEANVFNLQDEFKGYRADQILTSEIFNLTGSRSISIESKLKEYEEIYLKEESKRTDTDKNNFQKLTQELKNLPLWDSQKDKEQRAKILSILDSRNSGKNT